MVRKNFEYRASDPTENQRHAEGQGDFDRYLSDKVKLWTGDDGDNHIRILPRTWEDDEGPLHWAFIVYLHYSVGADGGTYLCPRKMLRKPCPMCEELSQLSDDADEKEQKALRPSKAALVYVINRNAKKGKTGAVIYKMPLTKVEQEICARSKDRETGALIKIDHHEKGRDVYFSKKGKGLNTQYSGVELATKRSPICDDPDEQADILDFINKHPIPKVLKFYDYDYLKEVFSGASSKDDDDDEDDAPRKKAKRRDEDDEDESPRSRKSSRVDDDEDDVDDEDEKPRSRKSSKADDDDEEEDDDKPARSSKRSARDDDDEDSDEEPPARKRRSSREDDDEEEEVDEPRAAKGKASKRTTRDEDDEDEEPEEDDDADEDDTPRRKSSKTSHGARDSKHGSRGKPSRDDDDDDEETPF